MVFNLRGWHHRPLCMYSQQVIPDLLTQRLSYQLFSLTPQGIFSIITGFLSKHQVPCILLACDQTKKRGEDKMAGGRPARGEAPAFGAKLSELRQSQGLSQAALAKILETTQPMVEYYERRAKNPGIEFAIKIAAIFGVTTDELLGVANSESENVGRKSKLDHYVDQVKRLPEAEQQYVIKFLEQVIERQR